MYTNTDRTRVLILTGQFRVEGYLYVLKDARLTDVLNSKSKDFFAITDAVVYTMDGETVIKSGPYLALNRTAIDCIMPIDADRIPSA